MDPASAHLRDVSVRTGFTKLLERPDLEHGVGTHAAWTPRHWPAISGKKKLGMLEGFDYAVRRPADFSVTTGSAVTAIVTRLCQISGKRGRGDARKASNRAKTRKAQISQKPLAKRPCGFESHSRHYSASVGR